MFFAFRAKLLSDITRILRQGGGEGHGMRAH